MSPRAVEVGAGDIVGKSFTAKLASTREERKEDEEDKEGSPKVSSHGEPLLGANSIRGCRDVPFGL